jgi:hypothetical protein
LHPRAQHSFSIPFLIHRMQADTNLIL